MRSPRKLLTGVVAGVVLIAALGWAVSTRLRSPADEAARRAAPRPSLVTAAVERRKLVSTVVVSGTLEYGSPLPISLAGVVGGTSEQQRVTRAPRKGRLTEGAVLMEVNGRPVFALRGSVPMHRTMAPGTKGDDIEQLQRALRRLGHRVPVSGVFDRATIAAVTRLYEKKGYEAQQPTLTDRQTYDTLRKAVQTAQETLATEKKTLDQGRDVLPLKVRLTNARAELRTAQTALEEAETRELTPEDDARLAAADAAERAAEEKLLEAEQALDAATTRPTAAPEATPSASTTPAPVPTPQQSTDTSLLEMRVANARADLAAARETRERALDEARDGRTTRLRELRKAVRVAREAVVTAEQALRQARQLSPTRLKVANAGKDLAAARAMLAEYARSYGVTVPPGEVVFLPKLPARVRKTAVKAGQTVQDEVATVTGSTFMVTGSVETAEAELLREGMRATIELDTGRTYPATLTAFGEKARLPGKVAPPAGSQPIVVTPGTSKGLRSLAGAAVTARVTVGATDDPVLVVPVAAVVTSADGKARVRVEYAADRTKDVEVRTGLTADGNVEVTGGLKEGDRVVVGVA
ncbi:peptidoglycan-binding protein [Nonomuraea roseoviolacea]|uniref:Peptidoglycan hydrolase-like protein with peptidoglycan-binding domain n=1 Tax=Nonomuraea roseoviolacea subsp. carminata TaxID=160689 RepID=A0ABT1JYI9_9ACTN|nr:peptidoglycan-binding protein [Nonomuraea roseoviolacea]MCP2346818.1 peptidoglycan hydrolase-like protein with peptidoglycan-binding domain [Nonomuraea roseoviolacea subsp. carminata]